MGFGWGKLLRLVPGKITDTCGSGHVFCIHAYKPNLTTIFTQHDLSDRKFLKKLNLKEKSSLFSIMHKGMLK